MTSTPARAPAPRHTIRRTARALAGLVGPLAYGGLVVLLGALTDGHDPVRDSMSELGAVDAAYRHVMNIGGFMVLGAMILAFGAGYWMQLRRGWPTATAAGLLVVAGGFMVAVGFFPRDPGCIDVTRTGRLHSFTSTPQAIALPLAAMVSAAAFRADGRLGTAWQVFSFWSGLAALATGPLIGADLVEGVTGAIQRLGMGLSLAWMAAVALKLHHLDAEVRDIGPARPSRRAGAHTEPTGGVRGVGSASPAAPCHQLRRADADPSRPDHPHASGRPQP